MTPAPEFSRPFAIDRLGQTITDVETAANPAECAALTSRLAIPAVLSLSCRWRLHRAEAHRIEAQARLVARLRRTCVITLDEFETEHAEEFRLAFVPAGKEGGDDDPEAPDELGYDGSSIDLGEAAAEQLALSLDPYPHKPGASLPDLLAEEDAAPAAKPSPFAVLARRARQE